MYRFGPRSLAGRLPDERERARADCTVSPRQHKLRPNLGGVCVPTDRIAGENASGQWEYFFLARSKSDRFEWPRSICIRAVGDAFRKYKTLIWLGACICSLRSSPSLCSLPPAHVHMLPPAVVMDFLRLQPPLLIPVPSRRRGVFQPPFDPVLDARVSSLGVFLLRDRPSGFPFDGEVCVVYNYRY
jgi:hypothetical protein